MNKEFGALIRQAREVRGLSQGQLAEQMGVDHTYISRVERGQVPSRAKVLEWLDLLEVTGPRERMPYLLAAGYLSYEDVAAAADAAKINDLDQTKEVFEILDEVRKTQVRTEPKNQQALEALEESLGPDAYSKFTQLAELIGKSNLDKDTTNRVLESALNVAKTILDAVVPPASQVGKSTKSRKHG